ncbi:reverse transcriptase domain-containing protein [Tanacetum coccineum]
MTNLTDMLSKFVNSNTASTSGSGTLPSNTITNPKVDLKGITTRSSVAYQGPTIPTTSSSPPKVVERKAEVIKDTVLPTNNGSTKDVQPPVVQVQPQVPNSEPVVTPVSAPMPNLKPSIPYPSRRNDERRREKANDQIEKFYKIFKDLTLIGNKEKLSEMARTPLNEHCSAVILNKLPEKLGDPSKFLIPCDFPRMDECLALADLGASINLMPLSVWKMLSLPKLTPTCMTLELADRSITQPIGIAEDVYLKLGNSFGDSDFLLEEVDAFLALEDDPTSPEVDDSYYDPEGDILLLESFLNDDPSLPPPTQGNYLPEIRKELKSYFQIPIDPHDQEKTTFTCPYGTFAYRRMPFGLCNAPGTFQRRSFMVKEGYILGPPIKVTFSKNRIEVDKAKVDVIAKLPHPTTVKGVRSFLGHAGFYRRFIKDFSKISRPMTHLLEKNTPFIFSNECIQAFETLKKKLTEAPILIAPDWDLPFELMCDASDFAIGAVLGQRHEKHFRPIHYASKTMNESH